MNETTVATTQQQYLTFSVSGDEYALAILRVKEIIAFDTVTRVPRTPAFIRGVINLRGSVVP
ncbi:MAG: purine-binding chemotaxis protein CheW, partial [Acidobacteriota bacterium]|nr:purine-binding chemotaxis protein CheW [Acidobacteriota bacterium]